MHLRYLDISSNKIADLSKKLIYGNSLVRPLVGFPENIYNKYNVKFSLILYIFLIYLNVFLRYHHKFHVYIIHMLYQSFIINVYIFLSKFNRIRVPTGFKSNIQIIDLIHIYFT